MKFIQKASPHRSKSLVPSSGKVNKPNMENGSTTAELLPQPLSLPTSTASAAATAATAAITEVTTETSSSLSLPPLLLTDPNPLPHKQRPSSSSSSSSSSEAKVTLPAPVENPFASYAKLIDMSLQYEKLFHLEGVVAGVRAMLALDTPGFYHLPVSHRETTQVIKPPVTADATAATADISAAIASCSLANTCFLSLCLSLFLSLSFSFFFLIPLSRACCWEP